MRKWLAVVAMASVVTTVGVGAAAIAGAASRGATPQAGAAGAQMGNGIVANGS